MAQLECNVGQRCIQPIYNLAKDRTIGYAFNDLELHLLQVGIHIQDKATSYRRLQAIRRMFYRASKFTPNRFTKHPSF